MQEVVEVVGLNGVADNLVSIDCISCNAPLSLSLFDSNFGVGSMNLEASFYWLWLFKLLQCFR
jgi:hypothetical protein